MIKPFGFPAWTGINKRIAKKIINRRGRNMFQRFQELNGFKIGDLVRTCDGLNSRVTGVEPRYITIKRGEVLVDLDITTDRNSCSLFHCNVRSPISYNQAIAYRDEIVKAWTGLDVWGFALKYSNMVIHKDGTYTPGDIWEATTREKD